MKRRGGGFWDCPRNGCRGVGPLRAGCVRGRFGKRGVSCGWGAPGWSVFPRTRNDRAGGDAEGGDLAARTQVAAGETGPDARPGSRAPHALSRSGQKRPPSRGVRALWRRSRVRRTAPAVGMHRFWQVVLISVRARANTTPPSTPASCDFTGEPPPSEPHRPSGAYRSQDDLPERRCF